MLDSLCTAGAAQAESLIWLKRVVYLAWYSALYLDKSASSPEDDAEIPHPQKSVIHALVTKDALMRQVSGHLSKCSQFQDTSLNAAIFRTPL